MGDKFIKSKLIFAALILFVLVSLTCVSAADNNQTADSVAMGENSISQEVLSDENADLGNFSSLQQEIAKSHETKYLELDNDYKFDQTSDSGLKNGVIIDVDDFVIDGKGFTLDGNKKARIFNIQANNVTLKNINFINGFVDTGNPDEDFGGAVLFSSMGNVFNCNFANNRAYSGGAIEFRGNGSVSNSNFINNSAVGFGGAVTFYEGAEGNVSNSNFANNSAEYGGAIFFADVGSVVNSNFTNGRAHGKNSGGGGAVLFLYGGDLFNCIFANNSAEYGGALVFNENNGHISYSKFIGNSAINGGAIFAIEVELFIENSLFDGNAAKGNTYNIFADDETTLILVNVTPENLFKPNFKDLDDEIKNCEGNTLILTKDYFYNPNSNYTSGITIDRSNFTIDGNGHIIDGSGIVRIFQITGDNVTLKNITFSNGYVSRYGGAVYFDTYGRVENCVFTNNEAGQGALYLYKGGIVIDSTFIGNEANSGGAVYCNRDGVITHCTFVNNEGTNYLGGAVYFNGYGNVSNSTFANNNAYNAGAIMFHGDGSIIDCTFTNNEGDYAGALCFNGHGNVTNCIFANNNASEGSGGAIFFGVYGNVTSCIFTNNAASHGGAIIFNGNGKITNCNFTNNRAEEGGAIAFYDEEEVEYAIVNVINSNFINNNAESQGGAIYFGVIGELTIKNSNFEGNTALDKSHNIYLNSGATLNLENVTPELLIPYTFSDLNDTINDCTGNTLVLISDYCYDPDVDGEFVNGIVINKENFIIDGNGHFIKGVQIARIFNIQANNVTLKNIKFVDAVRYDDNGGAVYFEYNGTVKDSNFINSHVFGDETAGGAIFFNDGGTVINSTFSEDAAVYGGAIYFTNQGTVIDSTFKDNNAVLGGAIYFKDKAYGNVSASSFTGNTAEKGGALYFDLRAYGDVTDSKFEMNAADNFGGAIYFGDIGFVTGSNFTNNSAGEDSGAVLMYGAGLLSDCRFLNNKAGFYGGAYSGKGSVINCEFINNSALRGAAIEFKVYADVNVTGSTFINNNASSLGGAIFILSDARGNIADSTFTGNYAGDGGGAIHVMGYAYGNVTNSNFTGNYAGDGGAIYIFLYGESDVSDSTFTGNYAGDEGGAIYIYEKTHVNITDSTFADNHAKNGGAIFFYDEGAVSDSNFTNNKADDCGGAIYFHNIGQIKGSSFDGNAAGIFGGAVFYNHNGNVDNSNFTNNQALCGGAIDFEQNATVTNSRFTDNKAIGQLDMWGGAIYIYDVGVISSCEFTGNFASDFGGAVAVFNGTIMDSNFTNNRAVEGGAINAYDLSVSHSNFKDNNAESGGAISIENDLTISYSVFEGNTATDGTNNFVSKGDGKITLINNTPENLGPSHPSYLTANAGDISYGGIVTIKVNVTDRDKKPIETGTVSVVINSKTYFATVNNGIATILIPKLNAGTYNNVNVVYNANDKYGNSSQVVNFTVSKINAAITAKDASYIINYGGSYSVTLKGVVGEKVKFTLNGKNIGSAITNANGVATIKLTAKVLKAAIAGTRNLIIKLDSSNYNPATKTVKIKINKEKTKIVAKKKTFKKAKRVKKYTITLKNSKGKAVKKVKVTLKIKGKTYKAKTNAKGKATFKIKKLTKKGTYKATVTFKGNAYYNKVTKKVKIRVM